MKKGFLMSIVMVVFMLFTFGNHESLYSKSPRQDYVLKKMLEINEQLATRGLNIAVESIEFFTIGRGRPSVRIHQQDIRWVPYDPNRDAQGIDITYLVDQSDGATASGLTNAQTESAIDRGLTTWNECMALRKVEIVKRGDPGADPDIYDFFFGFGGYGYPFFADIVNAGWYPWGFFEAVGGPGGGDNIIAFSVSFIWVDGAGNPTDINNDNYLDTALNEVYYNNTFGTTGEPMENYPWGIDVDLPGIDVESVALHENGHSLGVGHFGPPPLAVMNDGYRGKLQTLQSIDRAGMSTIWLRWPR